MADKNYTRTPLRSCVVLPIHLHTKWRKTKQPGPLWYAARLSFVLAPKLNSNAPPAFSILSPPPQPFANPRTSMSGIVIFLASFPLPFSLRFSFTFRFPLPLAFFHFWRFYWEMALWHQRSTA